MPGRFDTTRWSVVLAARDARGEDRQKALTALCEAYWDPIYAFVRRSGNNADAALDLTQGYFALLLEKDYLKSVDPGLGRFRSFLLVSVRHFLSNERDRERAAKRGAGTAVVSLDAAGVEGRLAVEPSTASTPEEAFERQWALTLLARAMAKLASEARMHGRETQFELLRGFLSDAGPGPRYREVAERLGVSESAVKVAVHRLRRRFGQRLREEILETVKDASEVDGEVRHLFAVLGRGGPAVP